MNKGRYLIFIGLAAILALSACNLPRAPRTTQTPTVSQITAAAQTVQAQLTQIAATMASTPSTPGVATVTLAPGVPTATAPAARTATSVYVPCDWVTFVADITVPDGTKINAGASFTKTWRLRNSGTCTWTTSYALVFADGDSMNGPVAVPLGSSVAPGQTIDISVNLTAPSTAGTRRGYWKLRNTAGATFGIGSDANSPFWVEVEVVAPTSTSAPSGTVTVYDFAANYCTAQWESGAGTLPCPGTTADTSGFVVRADNPQLQNGTNYSGSALETYPQQVDNGSISGRFSAMNVQSGHRFRAVIGCLSDATTCNVVFQLNYRANGGPLQALDQWNMSFSDLPRELNVDLSTLAGQSVEFVLAVRANGSSENDKAIWSNPRIVK